MVVFTLRVSRPTIPVVWLGAWANALQYGTPATKATNFASRATQNWPLSRLVTVIMSLQTPPRFTRASILARAGSGGGPWLNATPTRANAFESAIANVRSTNSASEKCPAASA